MHSFAALRLCWSAAGALALGLAAACAPARSAADDILGRWKRVDSDRPSFVEDPLGSLAQDYVEFRERGLLLDLIYDAGSGNAWTIVTGGYAFVDGDHIRIDGRCWQGYESHPCSQTYRLKLDRDHLTIASEKAPIGQVDYQRVAPLSADPPPTLAPPAPTSPP